MTRGLLLPFLALATGAAACSAPTQTGTAATPAQTTSGPVAMTPAPPRPAKGPGIGETCESGHTCGEGLECVGYYGIAGPRGPKFESCEKRCDGKSACPDGRRCTTIADGPGQVCR